MALQEPLSAKPANSKPPITSAPFRRYNLCPPLAVGYNSHGPERLHPRGRMTMRPRLTRAALVAAIASVALPLCAAPASSTNPKLADGIRQGEAQQAQIKTQVQRAGEDL